MDKEDKEITEACTVILNLWFQYGSRIRDCFNPDFEKKTTKLKLFHDCMSAGEDAVDFLEKHGYAWDDGGSAVVTEKGLIAMELIDYYLPWQSNG
jgi:hypothetical protein